MPFDIRQNRISKYKYNEEGRNKLELDEFILKIINEYEEIEKRFNSNQIKDHDTKVFNSFISLVDEKEFVDGLLSILFIPDMIKNYGKELLISPIILIIDMSRKTLMRRLKPL